jgi:adenosine deaminase
MDFKSIPKIENHIHLEGAIPYKTLWQLIQKYGGDKEVTNLNQLKEKFKYRDFNHFIEMWVWKNQFIKEYEDFKIISDAVIKDLINQNVKYAEIFISPSLFKKKLEIQKIVEAISESINNNSDIKINLIVDLVRDYGQESEMITLNEINEVKNLGIIGIGIGGSENKFPPELFIDLFEKARNFGYKTTAHAGEAAGADSIWKAIKQLRVDRIGHGTRAIEDSKLLDYLSEHKIPIELCPLSNLRTKVIKSMDEHPFKIYKERKIPISINTDDPKMFSNSLAEEYQALMEAFNLNQNEMYHTIIDSIKTTWLNEDDKEKLIDEFRKELEITAPSA